jgi:hypothetical protein
MLYTAKYEMEQKISFTNDFRIHRVCVGTFCAELLLHKTIASQISANFIASSAVALYRRYHHPLHFRNG